MTRTQINKAIAENEMAMDATNEVAFINGTKYVTEYPYNVMAEDIKAMSKEERRTLRDSLNAILNTYPEKEEWDATYRVYEELNYIEDEEYREENMADFRAYELKMNEPDFDWGWYSDWHKDMFGYRPHYRVIPQTEEEREALFHKFHTERWL